MARLRRTPQILQPHKNNDVAGKLAELSLTPSQREVTRVWPRPPYKYEHQMDPKIAHKQLWVSNAITGRMPTPPRDRRAVLEFHDNGLPMPLYKIIKKVVDILDHLKTHPDDEHAKFNLKIEENGIKVASGYFKSGKAMPSDWKYKRENAQKLLM